MTKSGTPYWWWFDGRHTKRSPWLQSTLAELDQRTQAILKLVEEDADSFAKRAEMYYERRPQVINMIEEFYRTHRSLLERYDQLKTVTSSGTRQHLLPNVSSPFPFLTKSQPENKVAEMAFSKISCDIDLELAHSTETEVDDPNHNQEDIDLETSCEIDLELEYSAESEVDDPEQADDDGIKEGVLVLGTIEATKLREEVERLREENRIQKHQLAEKDEEKKEVIRQLSFAVSLLMDDNARIRMGAGGHGIKGTFLRKLFQWPRIFQ